MPQPTEDEKRKMRYEMEMWQSGDLDFIFGKLKSEDPEVARSAGGALHNMMTNNTSRREVAEYPGGLQLMIETEIRIRQSAPNNTLPQTLAKLGVQEYVEQMVGWKALADVGVPIP